MRSAQKMSVGSGGVSTTHSSMSLEMRFNRSATSASRLLWKVMKPLGQW